MKDIIKIHEIYQKITQIFFQISNGNLDTYFGLFQDPLAKFSRGSRKIVKLKYLKTKTFYKFATNILLIIRKLTFFDLNPFKFSHKPIFKFSYNIYFFHKSFGPN
jgi:hypothetical protein